MKVFTNKKLWQKIVIIFLILILFRFIFCMPAHAAIKGDILLDPVIKLFVSIGDAIMSIMQDIMLQQGGEGGESLIKIDGDSGFWSTVIVAAVFILGTAVAIIAAIPSGGASAIAWVGFAGSAILTITVSGVIAAVSFSTLQKIVADQLGDTYYLPMYEITPYEIFANKVLLFDVNFFNPKEDISGLIKKEYSQEPTTPSSLSVGKIIKAGDEAYRGYDVRSHDNEYFLSKSEYQSLLNSYQIDQAQDISQRATEWGFGQNWISFDKIVGEEKYCLFRSPEMYTTISGVTEGPGYIVEMWKFESSDTQNVEQSTARQLQSIVASWYIALRNIALVALLSVLVYIGIRIVLSTVASDKAKYQQMLVDWVVALCLVFLMHYIMSFSMTIVGKLTDAVSSISIETNESKNNKTEAIETIKKSTGNSDVVEKMGNAVELVMIDATESDENGKKRVQNAWDILVEKSDDKDNNEYKSYFFKDSSLGENATSKDDAKVLLWPANNFMEQARIRLQLLRGNGDDTPKSVSYGYAIIYVVLVIYTLIFGFTYLRRVVYMAFLTIIAPLVAITYPIDKINDGKAQAFDMWLKEYIFNLLIQPLHLILYMILIGSAMSFAANNIFYVVLALGFFMPAEKILRRFFGFEKAQTPGMFGGAAGAALMMSGLNRIMNSRHPKGSLGAGNKEESNEETTQKKAPWRDKTFNDEENLVNTGEDAPQINAPRVLETEENTPQNTPQNIPQFDSRLTQEQRNELIETGLNPGDQEYNQYLRNHGIFGQDPQMIETPEQGQEQGQRQVPSHIINTPTNVNNDRIRITNNPAQPNNNNQRTRKRSLRRAIGQGFRSYGKGMKNKLHQRYKAKGGIGRRTIRMAAGVAGATALGAAGGIVGITSGDPSKAMQYMAAGVAGGYKVGTAGMERLNEGIQVSGSVKEAQKAYYGDDYKQIEQKKFKKQFEKDEENLRKIESKLKVERREAKEIMNDYVDYYLDRDIDNIDDIIATYRLETEGNMSRDQAVATTHYATQVMNNEDTRTMTAKRKKEYRDTFIPKFEHNNSRNPEADVDTLFSNIDKFHKFRK